MSNLATRTSLAPRKLSEVCNSQARWVWQRYKWYGPQVKIATISRSHEDHRGYLPQRKIIHYEQRTVYQAGQPSSYSSSELSILPVHPSLLQERSPIQLNILTARTTVKQNTIHRHPDCTTCQVNLNMIK